MALFPHGCLKQGISDVGQKAKHSDEKDNDDKQSKTIVSTQTSARLGLADLADLIAAQLMWKAKT